MQAFVKRSCLYNEAIIKLARAIVLLAGTSLFPVKNFLTNFSCFSYFPRGNAFSSVPFGQGFESHADLVFAVCMKFFPGTIELSDFRSSDFLSA